MSDKKKDAVEMIMARVNERIALYRNRRYMMMDQVFIAMFLIQWVAAILIAITISPYAWEGRVSVVHIHVWIALLFGGVIAAMPIALGLMQPGKTQTRYLIACAQMVFSALLIHLTGGRIETHFHVFCSLAVLAFYLDPGVLIFAGVTIALDHFGRQLIWPESVYGISSPEWWRFLEHGFWVVLEVAALILLGRRSLKDLKKIAEEFAYLEAVAENEGRSVLAEPVGNSTGG